MVILLIKFQLILFLTFFSQVPGQGVPGQNASPKRVALNIALAGKELIIKELAIVPWKKFPFGFLGGNLKINFIATGEKVIVQNAKFEDIVKVGLIFRGCSSSPFGCCDGTRTNKLDASGSNCVYVNCSVGAFYGCCPNSNVAKMDAHGWNCVSYELKSKLRADVLSATFLGGTAQIIINVRAEIKNAYDIVKLGHSAGHLPTNVINFITTVHCNGSYKNCIVKEFENVNGGSVQGNNPATDYCVSVGGVVIIDYTQPLVQQCGAPIPNTQYYNGCPGEFPGITPTQCFNLGCCFNSNVVDSAWCQPAIGYVNSSAWNSLCALPNGSTVDAWALFSATLPKIHVIYACYGGNCKNANPSCSTVVGGNQFATLSSACNGLSACPYDINYQVIGDPAPYCAKSYSANYQCLCDNIASTTAVSHSATQSAEATGNSILLSCANFDCNM